jgi:hypothetical protein
MLLRHDKDRSSTTVPLMLPDTNLVVGAFFADPRLAPLWAYWQGAPGRHACSAKLLGECRSVLQRPGLRRADPWPVDKVETGLQRLFAGAEILADADESAAAAIRSVHAAPDLGDQFLWDLLALHPTLVLVTRDKRLLKHKRMKARVWSPERAGLVISSLHPCSARVPASATEPLAVP